MKDMVYSCKLKSFDDMKVSVKNPFAEIDAVKVLGGKQLSRKASMCESRGWTIWTHKNKEIILYMLLYYFTYIG